jgi:hypothetical protein
VTYTLDRIIYSQTSKTVALSPDTQVTEADTEAWRSLINLDSQSSAPTWGLFAGPGRDFLLVAAHEAADETLREALLLPRKLLNQAAGNLNPILAQVMQTNDNLSLELPPVLPWSFDERLASFRHVLEDDAQGNLDRVLRLLGAALDDRHLLIVGYDGDADVRMALVQGLMALLPASARSELTFATHITADALPQVAIVFADSPLESARWVTNFQDRQFPDSDLVEYPYLQLLRDLWAGDPRAFIQTLDTYNPLAEHLLKNGALSDALTRLAQQLRLNNQVRAGEAVDPEKLKAVLNSDLPLADNLRTQYARQLLDHALEDRDTEAARLVAQSMDDDPGLDATLNAALLDALETQPDAVYVFVRTRLHDALEAEARWIERLQTAARVSLQVAIREADAETIINWLRLLAREPDHYNLHGILHDGILATQVRAHDDGDLARQLITLAIKHDPETLDTLLADPDFLAVVPNNLGLVLRDYSGEPLVVLEKRGVETFLVAMSRAAQAQAETLFTPPVVEQIWKIHTAGPAFQLPDVYQPAHIVDLLIDDGTTWLSAESRQHLLTLLLADGQDDLFYELTQHLAERDRLLPILGSALQASQRSLDDIITLGNHLLTTDVLIPQMVVDLYIELLAEREWRQTTLPLIEQVMRMVQQNAALDITPEVIWRFLDVAASAKSESVARVSAQQVFNDLEQISADEEGDDELVENLAELFNHLQWSQVVQQVALKWWRDFARQQSLARLVRLEKALDGKKQLIESRAVVQSTLAFRRMLGNRTLDQFAADINTVYNVLADIAESFDPAPRRSNSFDVETIRAELDARQAELTDHEWRILAKNLKELAALIGVMGDQRSKGGLVRQNVDRQLLAGEQQPESAVDTMKWMAGYVENARDRDEDEDS